MELTPGPSGLWWFSGWAALRVRAGLTGRRTSGAMLVEAAAPRHGVVEAEQVHGGSVALVAGIPRDAITVAGCDALFTRVPEVALLVRTADCLPVFLCDPLRWAVGLAHAGWRGLAAGLLIRLIASFRHAFHSDPADLRVAIGPAIRACCYEVGPEFPSRFGRFVRHHAGRLTCDLVGVATEQFRQAGVRTEHVTDSRHCTGCEPDQWCSLRREGQAAGRLTSLIMLRPQGT